MAVERVLFVTVTLLFTLSGYCTARTTASPVDIRTAAKQLVQDIRTVVTAAKNGQYLTTLQEDVLDLKFRATELVERLPTDVSECETNLVIKMAAAGTGSHEVLMLMLAQDTLAVLNGRLALSLAFLEHVAGQLEDELIKSGDIGPQLAAIFFGAHATSEIIESADTEVKTVMSPPTNPDNDNANNNDDVHNRVRRQSINLGGGFSLGGGGIKWQSGNGQYTITAAPKFKGFKVTGVNVGLVVRF